MSNDGEALAAMIAESDGSQVADLPAIELPVMLLVGTEEPFAEQAREVAELLPGALTFPWRDWTTSRRYSETTSSYRMFGSFLLGSRGDVQR